MSDSDDEYDPGQLLPSCAAPVPSTSTAAAANAVATSATDPFRTDTAQAPNAPAVHSSHSFDTANKLSSAAPSVAQKPGHASAATSEWAGAEGYRLHGITGRARCLCINPSGSILCAGGEDGKLCMWDFDVPLTSRRVQPTRVLTPFQNRIAGLQPIIHLHASLDGAYFVACQDGDSPALVAAGGKQMGLCAMGERGMVDVVRCKGHRAPVTCGAPHLADAARFITGAQDGTARLWDCSSFERGSTYAVKHGSGQLTDTIVVEAVTGVTSVGAHGSVFATGGEDGCVQLWDSRVRYRPGVSIGTWDAYALSEKQVPELGDCFEKHVGGLLELPASGVPVLAARLGAALTLFDLRQPSLSRGALLGSPQVGLPNITDTTPLALAADPGGCDDISLLTCTSRAGYRHIVGGHVVAFSYSPQSCTMTQNFAWRAGGPDEDVLAVCADRSYGAGGSIYACLSSGDVVVRGGVPVKSTAQSPVEAWLASRPVKTAHTSRALGTKASREEAINSDDDVF